MRQAQGFKDPEGAGPGVRGAAAAARVLCPPSQVHMYSYHHALKGQHIYSGANGMSVHACYYVTDFVCMNIVFPLNCEKFSSILIVSQ